MVSATSPSPIWTSAEGSMAQATAKTRWPVIVQGMIDDVQQTIDDDSDTRNAKEGLDIIQELQALKENIEGDAALPALPEDGSSDIMGYNAQLASFGPMSWHNCPWLFAECYLYRRVHAIISGAPSWRGYDIFARAKLSSLISSKTAVQELSARYMSLSTVDAFNNNDRSDFAYTIFVEMTQIALWGNATDLSLLTAASPDQLEAIQGRKAIEEGQARIVSNDMADAWTYLSAHAGGAVDIILDNAGFELFTDLLYSLYLIDSGLAGSVRLHVKSMPWFVSDVNPHDIPILVSTLSDPRFFDLNGRVPALAARIQRLLNEGRIVMEEHPFWTTGYDFQCMPAVAPDLLGRLSTSTLVVFKGDLNYRKLVRDATWPYTTPFAEALGPLAGPKGFKILALRTNKADVCVGVDEETVRRLKVQEPGDNWVKNGKYAVISLSVC
ncbi:hypothetical protein ACRALDRAFT_1050734 [Sodiomyces alcalophilus JCM 7366]|uniref:uncharacterized protein n=1 Tax=Sodiomyces alcalophilus JCM 7366 TaxID=591952 RepID=UPI0039B5BB16